MARGPPQQVTGMAAAASGAGPSKPSGRVGEGVLLQVGFKVSESLGHVLAAVAKTDMAGLVVNGAGKKKDTSVADNVFAESEDVLPDFETREAEGGGVWRGPIQEIGVPREKRGKQRRQKDSGMSAHLRCHVRSRSMDPSPVDPSARVAGARLRRR